MLTHHRSAGEFEHCDTNVRDGVSFDHPSSAHRPAGKQGDATRATDHRCLRRSFLGETFVWIVAVEKERQVLRTHSGAGICFGRRSNIPIRARGICRAHASAVDPNRFTINRLASTTNLAAGTRLAARCVSSPLLPLPADGPVQEVIDKAPRCDSRCSWHGHICEQNGRLNSILIATAFPPHATRFPPQY